MKVKLADIAEIKFCFPEKRQKGEFVELAFWATAADFRNDNVIVKLEKDENLVPLEQLRINDEDIIVKRINPTYVNYIDRVQFNSYAANNLILVRAKDGYNAKYIAYALNESVEKFAKNTSIGSVSPAITKSDLDSFEIALPSLREQELIGKVWFLNTERKKLMQRLSELEAQAITIKLNNYISKEETRNNGYNI